LIIGGLLNSAPIVVERSIYKLPDKVQSPLPILGMASLVMVLCDREIFIANTKAAADLMVGG